MQAKTAVAVLLLALMGVQAAVAVNTLRIKVPTPPMAPPSEGSMEAPAASESGDMSTESSAPPADMSESTDVQATRLKGGKNCEDNCDQGDSIEDAVRPVDDWLKSFKKREALGSGNLYSAAEAAARPLIRKLRMAQATALERLAETNENILRHVEEAATRHIYTLLQSSHKKEMEAEAKELKKEKEEEKRERAKEREFEESASF